MPGLDLGTGFVDLENFGISGVKLSASFFCDDAADFLLPADPDFCFGFVPSVLAPMHLRRMLKSPHSPRRRAREDWKRLN